MQNQRRHQQIEQIEIIERTVEEGSRPLTSTEAFAFQPVSSIRESTEKFISTGASGNDIERRFNFTNERDAGRDPSLLYSPSVGGLSQPSLFSSPPIHQSTPERSTSVNQIGYDINEVQTNASTARIVEMHGAGKVAGQLQSSPPGILKHTQFVPTEGSWRKSPTSESSVQRKDSYRRIQEFPHNVSYEQQLNVSTISDRSKKVADWTLKILGLGKHKQISGGGGSLDRLKGSIIELNRQIRDGEWSPRLVAILIFAFLLLLILLLLFWFVFSSLFLSKSAFSFWLYPPICEECQRQTGSSKQPSRLYVHLHSSAQFHFELVGSSPFKSNSFTAVDFETGYIAIADHSLTDSNGRHTVCFIMQLDTSALPDMDTLKDALKRTFQEVHAQFGWQEYWQFTLERVDQSFTLGKFNDRIEDCQNVQWYLLKHSLYTNDESCSYCYDFCLPDYAVLRRQKYEDEVSIGVRRLNCFRLYIPEWSKFQTDVAGGHFVYPVNQPQNTQRDENGNWANWKYTPQQQNIT